MIHIDEVCPHCQVPLYMKQDRSLSRSGFHCPACKKGVIWIGSWGKRLQAVTGFGVGGVLVMLMFMIFLMIGAAVVLVIVTHWREHYVLLTGVSLLYVWLFVLVARWTWGAQRAFVRLLMGRNLIPARRDDRNVWRFDITPSRPKIRRSRDRDMTLDGAMTVHDTQEAQRGALSLEDRDESTRDER